MKIKRFSGYSEAAPSGVTYHSSQVITKYVLDPIDKSVDLIESKTPGAGKELVKQKSSKVKRVVKPLKKYFKSITKKD